MTGKIILSCGHEEPRRPLGIRLHTKDYECDAIDGFSPAISCGTVCLDCYLDFVKNNLDDVFFSEFEENEWLDEEMRKTEEGRKLSDLKEAEHLEKQAKKLKERWEDDPS